MLLKHSVMVKGNLETNFYLSSLSFGKGATADGHGDSQAHFNAVESHGILAYYKADAGHRVAVHFKCLCSWH